MDEEDEEGCCRCRNRTSCRRTCQRNCRCRTRRGSRCRSRSRWRCRSLRGCRRRSRPSCRRACHRSCRCPRRRSCRCRSRRNGATVGAAVRATVGAAAPLLLSSAAGFAGRLKAERVIPLHLQRPPFPTAPTLRYAAADGAYCPQRTPFPTAPAWRYAAADGPCCGGVPTPTSSGRFRWPSESGAGTPPTCSCMAFPTCCARLAARSGGWFRSAFHPLPPSRGNRRPRALRWQGDAAFSSSVVVVSTSVEVTS